MVDDIKKSINSILHERTTSPFFGTLLLSWVIWNWKIIYLTLFISEKTIPMNKIDYITAHFTDKYHLIVYPLISTIALLTIVPFASNGAYWLSLKFNQWKKNQKRLAEKKELPPIEHELKVHELRVQIDEQEREFKKLLGGQISEIEQLEAIIESLRIELAGKTNQENKKSSVNTNQKEMHDLVKRIKNDYSEKIQYEELLRRLQLGYSMDSEWLDPYFLSLMEDCNIIQSKGGGIYQLTDTGRKFHRLMAKQTT